MPDLAHLPASLEPMRVYLKRAEELKRASTLASFAIRSFAFQVGMSLRERCKATDMQFLEVFMDELERERTMHKVSPTGEEQEAATKALALDLYGRAKSSDRPDLTHPQPSNKWTVVDAPRVAQAYHASAVLFDTLRQFEDGLPPQLEEMQLAAHRRSQQLAQQLVRALSSSPCVPPEWRPFPTSKLLKPKPAADPAAAAAPAAAPAPAPSALPSSPGSSPAAADRPSTRSGLPLLPSVPTSPRRPGQPAQPPAPPPSQPADRPPPALANGAPAAPPAAPPMGGAATTAANQSHPPLATPPAYMPSAATPGNGAAAGAVSAAAPTGGSFTYSKGHDVWYRDEFGRWQASRIDAVHYDASPPYYTCARAYAHVHVYAIHMQCRHTTTCARAILARAICLAARAPSPALGARDLICRHCPTPTRPPTRFRDRRALAL